MQKKPQNYTLAITVSLLLHVIVAVLLFWKWPEVKKVMEPAPKHVIAEVIQVESAAEKERKQKIESKRRRDERAAQQRKRQQELQAKQQAEEKRKEQQAIKEKALAEMKAKEETAKEQLQKELAKQRQQQEESLLENLLKEERLREQKEQQEAQRQSEKHAAAMVSEFTEQIRAHVSSYWSYPSVVKPDDEVTVNIILVPTGEVVNVQVTQGSGNALLDSSVLQAIRKASPLPVPKDIRVFEKDFRNFKMKFRPENALW